MTPGRLRAGVVVALIVVCSALAGAAAERLLLQRTWARRPGASGGPGHNSPEQDARRRNEMLDRMTKELNLSRTQRAGIDSVMTRADSSLRAIRTEMHPRLKLVFQDSRAEIESRLDSAQRVTFAKSMLQRGHGPRRP